MLTTLLLASVARAEPEGSPTCHPIADGVEALIRAGGMDEAVFVEEYSACEGGAASPTAVEPDPALEGRAAIEHMLGARSSDYSVELRAGGWLVAPTTGTRLFDVLVDVETSRSVVMEARASMFGQLAIQEKVWLPPGGSPGDQDSSFEPNGVTFDDLPLLEGLLALYTPHGTTTGLLLRVDTTESAARSTMGRRQAQLVRLVPPEEQLPGIDYDESKLPPE